MKVNDRLEIKIYYLILTEKKLKCQHYHQVKFDKYEYLTGEEALPSKITSKSRNIYENLLIEIKQIVYSMYKEKEVV